MKQKNLILMVVAVGCGLVAAFLTSQISGKPKEVPQVEIVAAAKELAPGVKFTKDSMKDLLKRRKVNPNEVPQNAFLSEDELDGKTLVKTLRADDFISQGDLGDYRPIVAPEGKSLICLKLPIDKVTPFVKPTSRVDLLGTLLTDTNKVKGTVLIPNMLVMAVDTETLPAPGTQGGKINIQTVTLAASTDEANLIRMAETANVRLSFLLHGDDDGPKKSTPWSMNAVIEWINNAATATTNTNEAGPNTPDTPKPVSGPTAAPGVKIWVPKEDLPAGTPLDAQLFETKFREIEWKGALPDNVVMDIRAQAGKYLIKDAFAGFPVAKTAVGDKPVAKAAPAEERTEKAAPDVPAPAPKAKPKPTVDQTIQGPSGAKTYRYERQEDGKWKLIGEVGPDGSVGPATAPAAPAQPQPPQPQPHAGPEPRIT
jgi:Flp pilus assembly protein CpaB